MTIYNLNPIHQKKKKNNLNPRFFFLNHGSVFICFQFGKEFWFWKIGPNLNQVGWHILIVGPCFILYFVEIVGPYLIQLHKAFTFFVPIFPSLLKVRVLEFSNLQPHTYPCSWYKQRSDTGEGDISFWVWALLSSSSYYGH